MKHYILADDETGAATFTGDLVNVANNDATEYGLVHVAFGGGTGNVLIQGRLDSSLPWVTITTRTTDSMERITAAPQMRATGNTLSGATVRVIFRA